MQKLFPRFSRDFKVYFGLLHIALHVYQTYIEWFKLLERNQHSESHINVQYYLWNSRYNTKSVNNVAYKLFIIKSISVTKPSSVP